MKELVSIRYEAFDGTNFEDCIECCKYEIVQYYERSGIRFRNAKGRVMKITKDDPDNTYNTASFITIDRTKEKVNEEFIDAANELYGWCLLEDLRNGSGKKYRMHTFRLEEIE